MAVKFKVKLWHKMGMYYMYMYVLVFWCLISLHHHSPPPPPPCHPHHSSTKFFNFTTSSPDYHYIVSLNNVVHNPSSIITKNCSILSSLLSFRRLGSCLDILSADLAPASLDSYAHESHPSLERLWGPLFTWEDLGRVKLSKAPIFQGQIGGKSSWFLSLFMRFLTDLIILAVLTQTIFQIPGAGAFGFVSVYSFDSGQSGQRAWSPRPSRILPACWS